jgi:hypothetical protein
LVRLDVMLIHGTQFDLCLGKGIENQARTALDTKQLHRQLGKLALYG